MTTTPSPAQPSGQPEAPDPDEIFPRVILRFVEDEMVTLHKEGRYLETLFMSCPEQANDFKERFKDTVIYSLNGWLNLKEEFQKNWKSKYSDEDDY